MINAKEIIDNSKAKIQQLFQPKVKSQLSLVRIAINFNDILQSESIVKQLHDMGYSIGLNMMQSHGKSEQEYIQVAKDVSSWNVVDVLYFADSLGNMTPKEVEKICRSLRSGWVGSLGIQTHNNKNLALIPRLLLKTA